MVINSKRYAEAEILEESPLLVKIGFKDGTDFWVKRSELEQSALAPKANPTRVQRKPISAETRARMSAAARARCRRKKGMRLNSPTVDGEESTISQAA